jgi:hypothetical protein
MKLRLISNKLSSQSLKRVADGLSIALGYKVWRGKHSKPNRKEFKYGDQKSKLDQYTFFKAQGLSHPEYTTDKQVAQTWLSKGWTVLARTLLNSSEGKGIIVVEPTGTLPNALVYTKYIPKKKEYRVHLFQNKVVCVLEKRRKTGITITEPKIRNTANGYVFCQEGVTEIAGLRELALASAKVTTSDFRGVDIGYNEKKNLLYVIEVNSAPGIEGSNVAKYVEAIVNA